MLLKLAPLYSYVSQQSLSDLEFRFEMTENLLHNFNAFHSQKNLKQS
jgi:hypothetical protein